MEIGKVIKLKNCNLIRWSRKLDIGFPLTLFSFYKIMKITRWLKDNRLIRRKKKKKTEKLEILSLKCLIISGRVKCEKTYLKEYSTWYHTWTLCKIISYDFKIDDMISILLILTWMCNIVTNALMLQLSRIFYVKNVVKWMYSSVTKM